MGQPSVHGCVRRAARRMARPPVPHPARHGAVARRQAEKLHLRADDTWTRDLPEPATAGYQQRAIPFDATLLMVGAGTAHGVHPLDDGLSPFRFQRRPPRAAPSRRTYTSMVLVPAGEIPPEVGDVVDVQRPLINTVVDEVVWR